MYVREYIYEGVCVCMCEGVCVYKLYICVSVREDYPPCA